MNRVTDGITAAEVEAQIHFQAPTDPDVARRKAEAERFLMLLDEEAKTFCFQTFDDNKDRVKSRKERARQSGHKVQDPFACTIHGSIDQLWDRLEQMNLQGAGVYVTVNPVASGQARLATNITGIRAVFADFDPPDTRPAPAQYPLQPVWEVETSPGKRHAYWSVDGLALTEFTAIQARIIETLGSDPAPKDLSRVMRVPGFRHMKNPAQPFMVRLLNVDERLPYSADEIRRIFPPIEQAKRHGTKAPSRSANDDYSTESFFAQVNHKAMLRLSDWVPALFPSARPYHDGYRVDNVSLGRVLEEDISIVGKGIEDFGTGQKHSPIDLVVAWGSARDIKEAAHWLCKQMGVNPSDLGWNEPTRPEGPPPAGPGEYEEILGAANPANPLIWSDPEPLRAPLSPAEPYPVDALGDVLGSAVTALHESVKAPLALCAQSVLAAASFAAQAHFDAKMPWGEIKPLSLIMLTVGESGERKSGVDDLVLGAAKAQERAEMECFEEKTADYEVELAAWKKASEQAAKGASVKGKGTKDDFMKASKAVGDAPLAPVVPLRFVTDPTVEGLYKLLAIGQPSVALFSDEGGLLIGGHALNSDNALKTMARWCKLWDGSPFDRVRAGDGSGILYGRRMAMHQLGQPDIMTVLLSDPTANGQGFLARALMAWPQSTIGTRHIDGYEWAGNRREIKRLFGKLKTLFETQPRVKDKRGQVLDPQPLELNEAAIEIAVAANNQFETLMAPGQPLCEIRDRASKAMDNAIRIAGVLTAIEDGLKAATIDQDRFSRGLILVQWYLAESLRIRGASAIPQAVTDAEMLLDWLKDRGLTLFRSANVLTRGPSQLRNKPRFSAAVAELVINGYLVEAAPGTEVDGIKAKQAWRVNPHVF